MSIQKIMEKKLHGALDIKSLEIINESHLHKGHAGDDGSGASHFVICISAAEFSNRTTLDCHKLIYEILEAEMKIIHALSIKVN